MHIFVPLLRPAEVQSMDCKNIRSPSKRDVDWNTSLGGKAAASPHDEAVLAAAKFAATEMNHRSNSLYRDMLLDVTHVVRQVW